MLTSFCCSPLSPSQPKFPKIPDLYCYDLYRALELFVAEISQVTTYNYNSVFDKFSKIVLLTIDEHEPLKHYSRRREKLLKKP